MPAIDLKDFFVSYKRADKVWAEWIAWTLEEAGYSVLIQAWDFRPGGNFVLDMQRAAAGTSKTIAVLSDAYLKSAYPARMGGSLCQRSPIPGTQPHPHPCRRLPTRWPVASARLC